MWNNTPRFQNTGSALRRVTKNNLAISRAPPVVRRRSPRLMFAMDISVTVVRILRKGRGDFQLRGSNCSYFRSLNKRNGRPVEGYSSGYKRPVLKTDRRGDSRVGSNPPLPPYTKKRETMSVLDAEVFRALSRAPAQLASKVVAALKNDEAFHTLIREEVKREVLDNLSINLNTQHRGAVCFELRYNGEVVDSTTYYLP